MPTMLLLVFTAVIAMLDTEPTETMTTKPQAPSQNVQLLSTVLPENGASC